MREVRRSARKEMSLSARPVTATVDVTCELFRDAFLLARNAKRPAYDMFYLALARRQDAVLLTSDTALKKEAVRLGIQVIA